MEEEQEEKGIKITYETLFDIKRNEQNRESLQKLDKSFYMDVRNYLLEKNNLLENQRKGSDLFSTTEKNKTEKQLENAKRIIKEIYDRREKKIISMAINKSRIYSNLIDASALLDEEKPIFEKIVWLLNRYRNNLTLNILEGKESVMGDDEIKEEVRQEIKELEEAQEKKEEPDKYIPGKTVKFLKPIQRFVGKELEVYGPFEEGDTAELPVEIADILVNKGSAEEV